MTDYKTIYQFITNNDVEFSNNRIDIKTLNEYIEKFDLKMGEQLQKYILEYGFLKFDTVQFYGINNIEKMESNMIKETLYYRKNYPREIKKFINFGNLKNGNILLVDCNDIVYCWGHGYSIQNTGVKFFDYILNIFAETEKLNRHDEKWNEKYFEAKIIWKFKNFDKKYLNDKEIVMQAVKNDGNSLEFAGEKLKNDRDVVMEAVQKNGKTLRFVGKELKNNEEVIMQAVCQNIEAFEFVSMQFKENDNFMKNTIKICNGGLKYASENLKKDRNFIIELVKINGMELAYASKELREDKEVCLSAIDQDIRAFLYVQNEEIQNNIKYVKKLLKNNERYIFSELSEKWRDNEEIVRSVVSEYGELLEFASERLKDDKKIVLEAIECKCNDMWFGRGNIPQSPLKYASGRLKDDDEIVLKAIMKNNEALRFASKRLKNKYKKVVIS